MFVEGNRTKSLLVVAIVVGVTALVGVCGVGGYLAYKYSQQDNRTCKEQVEEFTNDLYAAATLQASATELAADGQYGSALVNARNAEKMMYNITAPSCSDAAGDVLMYEKRAVVAFRKSLDAIGEGNINEAIALQEEATAAVGLANDALQRLLDEQ